MTTIAATTKKRIESIDILRGIVMMIMALDHARDFFTHNSYDPTDLTKASTGLFLTRFITHFCAPTFVFLAGTGAFLSLNRGKTKGEASVFLLTRGLWLVLLELTVVGIGWSFDPGIHFLFVQVIWALGISMVVLSLLIYLPVPAIAAVGLVMIFGHNLLDSIKPENFEGGKAAWHFIHVMGMADLSKDYHVFVLYPLIPWIGVMAVGYSFGKLFKLEPDKRQKLFYTIGASTLALFVIVRAYNHYGDPNQWTDQGVWYRTILSFVNVQKYPPSLDYLLITLGTSITMLGVLEHVQNRFTNIALVFGRVPLFYYILHLYLLHTMGVIAYIVVKNHAPNSAIMQNGAPLYFVYMMWALALFILYFPCRWYMKYKMTHKQWWLSYL
ncbi:heparan-alpha-glucosaminide N-acetyltransferase domain-containing protein [Mucilaginibacter gynuensis]|uniref:Heparan-alpha-glucosaminide N-acetyltransferase domain-containing protein n=1 Tax=Mucilaginibacter gynuensis TaxID=1302236 RepID=A0ABP8GTK6_9SPHI